MLYSPWSVTFKASGTQFFFEARSLYFLSLSKYSFFLKEIADQNQTPPSSFFVTYHPFLQFNLLTPTPSKFLNFQSINHVKSHAIILCFSHSYYFTMGFWGAFFWLKLIRKINKSVGFLSLHQCCELCNETCLGWNSKAIILPALR